MTDYGPLDAAVSAIRGANPKIAACFDEVEKILKTVAPPSPPPVIPGIVAVTGGVYTDLTVQCPPPPARAIEVFYAIQNVTLRRVKASGGRLAHVYGSGSDPTQWPTNVLCDTVDLTAMVEDLWHVDGANGLTITGGSSHDPTPNLGAHCDGVQIEAGQDITVSQTFFTWPITPRRDGATGFPYGGGAIFVSQSQAARPCRRITLDRPVIHQWWGGRAIQMFVSGKIISPDIIDCGLGWNGSFPGSPPITLNAPADGGIIELHPASTGMWSAGVRRSDVYFNDYSGPGWPSYVRVF